MDRTLGLFLAGIGSEIGMSLFWLETLEVGVVLELTCTLVVCSSSLESSSCGSCCLWVSSTILGLTELSVGSTSSGVEVVEVGGNIKNESETPFYSLSSASKLYFEIDVSH